MADINPVSEEILRPHVRNLLFDYSMKHLTSDYIQSTEEAVSQLLSVYLTEIPTTDPNSLVLPADPFNCFIQMHGLSTMVPYDEKLQTNPEALQYIKSTLKTKPGKPKSERICYEESNYEPSIYRPISPVLTLHSQRNTPQLGRNQFLKSMPKSHATFLASQTVQPLEIEVIQEPKASIEEILHLGWNLHVDERTAVSALFKATALLSGPRKNYTNSYLDPTRRIDSPPPAYQRPESPFLPIFPRNPVGNSCSKSLASIANLPMEILPKVKVEEFDTDLSNENMLVVDGWHTFVTSSPSTLSTPTSSQGHDQLDQLFMISSPDTEPPYIEVLMSSKMDTVEFPRSKRIGGEVGRTERLGEGKDFASFLLPLLPKATIPDRQTDHRPARSSPEPSVSMLGQPPSHIGTDKDNGGDNLDADVFKLYATTSGKNPKDLIMDEKLDEKNELLMDVPELPPPNVHPSNALFLPTSMVDFVAPAKSTARQGGNILVSATHEYLKKAKAIQSLTVALSWVPFTLHEQLPSHAQICGVSMLFIEQHEETLEAKLNDLFDRASVTGRDSDYIEKSFWTQDKDVALGFGFIGDINQCEIILTRAERRRLSGIADHRERDVSEVPMGNKAVQDSDDSDLGKCATTDERPAKRARLDHDSTHVESIKGNLDSINDSGIGLQDTSDLNVFCDLDADMGTINDTGARFSPFFYDDSASFFPDANKENLPPFFSPESSSGPQNEQFNYQSQDLFHDDRESQELYTGASFAEHQPNAEFENEHGGFIPLSFDSHQAMSQIPNTYMPNEHDDAHNNDFWKQTLETYTVDTLISPIKAVSRPASQNEDDTSGQAPPLTLNTLLTTPDLATRSLGPAAFAQLRAKKVTQPTAEPSLSPILTPAAIIEPMPSPVALRGAPVDLVDHNTLRNQTNHTLPITLHRYMASLDIIQKQALVRSLRSRACSVDLIERESLGGADLIIDPHTAILFFPLLVLPSQCESLKSRIAAQSWLFSRLLIIFEAYPESCSYKYDHRGESALNAYTPPIIKAVRKLRRDLGIAEACGMMRTEAKVQFAFADTVDDAALMARYYGDLTEGLDQTRGAIWGDRAWLDEDMSEDEENLATLNGLNRFSASIILCQISVQEFLNMTPETRIEEFNAFLGIDTMNVLNADLEHRFSALESSDMPNDGLDDIASDLPAQLDP